MKEKILTVLVVVSLVLSVFSLVLTIRSNGTNAIANLLGEPSNVVTWKKVELNVTSVPDSLPILLKVQLWNVTITLLWSNGTVSTYDCGDSVPYAYPSTYFYMALNPSPTTLGNNGGGIVDINNFYSMRSPIANITSVTGYEIQPPQ
jgi:hypothetical protein